MIEFRCQQLKAFSNLYDALKNTLPDTEHTFSNGGITINQMDPTSMFLLNVNLDASNFEYFYYDPNNPEKVNINLSTENLVQVFKSTGDDNMMEFIYERKSDFVKIVIYNTNKKERRTYEIPIQQPDDDRFSAEGISDLNEYSFHLTMPSNDLKRILQEFKTMENEDICISITENGNDSNSLIFTGDSKKIKSSVERRSDGQSGDNVYFQSTAKDCTYSDVFKLTILLEFAKCQSKGDNIVGMYFNQSMPMILEITIGTLGRLIVFIGPRKTDDDEL